MEREESAMPDLLPQELHLKNLQRQRRVGQQTSHHRTGSLNQILPVATWSGREGNRDVLEGLISISIRPQTVPASK